MMARLLLIIVQAFLVGMLGIISLNRNEVWIEDISLWIDTATKSPNKRSAEHTAFIYYGLGMDLIAAGREEEAMTLFRKSVTIKPNYAKPYYEMGLICQKRGDMEQASMLFNTVIDRDPRNDDALIALGIIAAQQGKYEKAYGLFSRATAVNPRSAGAFHNLASAKYKMGEFQSAIKLYSTAITLDPAYGRSYYDRSMAHRAVHDRKRMLQDLKQACERKFEAACSVLQEEMKNTP